MPYPGTTSTPYFRGRNTTSFLDQCEDLCFECGLMDEERLSGLPRYCEMLTGQTIETIKEWKGKNWKGLKAVLRDEYKKDDTAQQYHSRSFLETYKKKPRDDDDVRGSFVDIPQSWHNYEDRKLDNHTRVAWFIQGLPPFTRTELFPRGALNLEELADVEFDDVLDEAPGLAKSTSQEMLLAFRDVNVL